MNNEIIVNAERGETRVALLEGSSFTELHIERGSDRNVMGSVILGRVSRVLPGMQAAFVDIGLEKAAFLYAGDYIDTKSQTSGSDGSNPRRHRGNGRSHIQIDAILKEGQEIVVHGCPSRVSRSSLDPRISSMRICSDSTADNRA